MDLEELIMLGACSLLPPVRSILMTTNMQPPEPTGEIDGPDEHEIAAAVVTAKRVWAEVLKREKS